MQVHGAFYLAGILSALANPRPHSTTAMLLISIAVTGPLAGRRVYRHSHSQCFAWASLSVNSALDDRVAPELEGQVLKVGGVVDSFAIRRGGLVSFVRCLDVSPSSGSTSPLYRRWVPSVNFTCALNVLAPSQTRAGVTWSAPCSFAASRDPSEHES